MTFKKGQSGNPKGRRAEKPFRDALNMELVQAGENHKALREIAKRLIKEANSGNLNAIKEVADRMDGKAAQQVALTGPDDADGNPTGLEIRFVKPEK